MKDFLASNEFLALFIGKITELNAGKFSGFKLLL